MKCKGINKNTGRKCDKEAMIGGYDLIKRCKPILILETEVTNRGLYESEWFRDNILSLGYKLIDKLDQNLVYKIGE